MSTIFIIMGVSGAGKSTIGKALSTTSGIPFFDADDYHPQANVDKMSRGEALNDDDRWPWLRSLAELLKQQEVKNGAILACSALKNSYRELMEYDLDAPANWVYLDGTPELIAERVAARSGHFMPPELLQSQFDTLEVPDEAIRVSIDQSVDDIISDILTQL